MKNIGVIFLYVVTGISFSACNNGGGGGGGGGDTNVVTPPGISADLVDSGTAFEQLIPNPVYWGEGFQALVMVGNNGDKRATSFWVSLYASTDSRITTSDIFLGRAQVSDLAAGASQIVIILEPDAVMKFPSIPAGKYYIGYIIDSDGEVNESNESNNIGLCTTGTLNVIDQSVSGTGGIRGLVKDSSTDNPISGARVSAGGIEDTTNIDGHFSLQFIRAGPQILSARKAGYNNVDRPMTVIEDISVLTIVYMTPVPNQVGTKLTNAPSFIDDTTETGDKLYYYDTTFGNHLEISLAVPVLDPLAPDQFDLGVNRPSTGTFPTTAASADMRDLRVTPGALLEFTPISNPSFQRGRYYILVEKIGSGGPFRIRAWERSF